MPSLSKNLEIFRKIGVKSWRVLKVYKFPIVGVYFMMAIVTADE